MRIAAVKLKVFVRPVDGRLNRRSAVQPNRRIRHRSYAIRCAPVMFAKSGEPSLRFGQSVPGAAVVSRRRFPATAAVVLVTVTGFAIRTTEPVAFSLNAETRR